MDWDELVDASGDGRGRKDETTPRLQSIAAGEEDSGIFGPYKSKASAKLSMRNAMIKAETAAIEGLTFKGPRSDKAGVKFYFGVTK